MHVSVRLDMTMEYDNMIYDVIEDCLTTVYIYSIGNYYIMASFRAKRGHIEILEKKGAPDTSIELVALVAADCNSLTSKLEDMLVIVLIEDT